MKLITITYTAPVAPQAQPIDEIFARFVPTNAAADNPVFDGTYYDTNVKGWGEATTIEQFMKDSVAHPGLIAILRKAIADGSYSFESDDLDLIVYLGEVAPAVAGEGFVIEIADSNN